MSHGHAGGEKNVQCYEIARDERCSLHLGRFLQRASRITEIRNLRDRSDLISVHCSCAELENRKVDLPYCSVFGCTHRLGLEPWKACANIHCKLGFRK